MKTEIYYFSGTGNSLYIAWELQKRLTVATLIPVIGALKRETIKTNTESVGFIFPNFCLSMYIPVYDFLKKSHTQISSKTPEVQNMIDENYAGIY